MTDTLIDLRSDTVTRPTLAMRAVMAAAPVGDDVLDEDPTIHELQEQVAAWFGKESALFVPSGTMSNQIAIRCHTQPGDEILTEATNHIYVWEAGGPAVLSGVTCRTLHGEDGILDVSQFHGKIRPDNEHYTRTRLVCLENTHNRGGGRVFPFDKTQAISTWARAHGLAMHLDGARVWNAIVALGISPRDWGRQFDTLSVCFSKGLGAPIGSALIGTAAMMAKARRVRKLFGGGMRQGGIAAAGALFAFNHHMERLADDHRHARMIGQAIADTPGLRLAPPVVETNLIWFEVDPDLGTAADVKSILQQHGVLISDLEPQVCRACTHLDVSASQAERAADIIRKSIVQMIPA